MFLIFGGGKVFWSGFAFLYRRQLVLHGQPSALYGHPLILHGHPLVYMNTHSIFFHRFLVPLGAKFRQNVTQNLKKHTSKTLS